VVRPSRGPAAHPVGQSELRRGVEGATRPARAHARASGSGGGSGRGWAGAAWRAGFCMKYRDLIEDFPNVNRTLGGQLKAVY
jgi:hypothetical protein